MIDVIEQELNENQREAVFYIEGPSLVIAGAGSGKTRVLTYKIAYLLSKGYPAESILALTFTNKAAREMKERIADMIGWHTARRLWMGTFHSIFSRILRNEAESIGFSSQFTIYDSADSKSLIKAIVKELNLDDKEYKPNSVAGRISFAKNNLLSPATYRSNEDLMRSDAINKMPKIADIYAIYMSRCKMANAMDFDDLLYYTNVLFRDFPAILEKYQSFFGFILVDEYQDTNFAQYLIVKKLAERHHKLCVVGDDAQSIYSFRGANIDNILNFKQSYPEAKIFKLEQNYRSTQTIVNAANSLIAKNNGQIRKHVFSEKECGEKIKVHAVYSDYDEAFTIANEVYALHEQSPYSEFAILYRTNSQSRILEESFRKRNIPYRIYGGLSFYQRKEIKDVIAYFRMVINPEDEEALKRIINVPTRGIGNTTINKLLEAARMHQLSVWEVLSNVLKYNLSINSGTALKLEKFRSMISSFQEQQSELNAYEIGRMIVKTSGIISDALQDKTPESLSRKDNIEELLKAMYEFCALREEEEGVVALLRDFLSEVSLLTDQDTDKDDDERVTMMTVHASKGLEFSHVFIVGMEEELFPSSRVISEKDLEEERRLFYVAITRAKVSCQISYAKSRFRNGKTNFCNPSRFLQDIDDDFLFLPAELDTKSLQDISGGYKNPFLNRTNLAIESKPLSPFPSKKLSKIPPVTSSDHTLPLGDNSKGLQVGEAVEHSIFGEGRIIAISGSGADARATVDFDGVGQKKLLLKYAKLIKKS